MVSNGDHHVILTSIRLLTPKIDTSERVGLSADVIHLHGSVSSGLVSVPLKAAE